MKRNFLVSIIMAICLSLISGLTVFADMNSMIEKQKEIDQFIFVEKKDELAQKGITVSTSAPLENYVEIGITPYTEENASYFYDKFGKDTIKVVKGMQNVTKTTVNEETETTSTLTTNNDQNDKEAPIKSIYIIAAVFIALAGITVIVKKKSMKSNS
jgi:hypothetical protein